MTDPFQVHLDADPAELRRANAQAWALVRSHLGAEADFDAIAFGQFITDTLDQEPVFLFSVLGQLRRIAARSFAQFATVAGFDDPLAAVDLAEQSDQKELDTP